MKKFTSLILALVMVFALSVSAVAEDITSLPGESSAAPVTVKINENALGFVYKVSITWGTLDFVYNKQDNAGVWDTSTHTYSGQSSAGWVANPDATIKVNNHSNAQVDVSATFSNGELTSAAKDGVSATIASNMAFVGATKDVRLANAAEAAYGESNKDGVDQVTIVTFTVTPSGQPGNTEWSTVAAELDTIKVSVKAVNS